MPGHPNQSMIINPKSDYWTQSNNSDLHFTCPTRHLPGKFYGLCKSCVHPRPRLDLKTNSPAEMNFGVSYSAAPGCSDEVNPTRSRRVELRCRPGTRSMGTVDPHPPVERPSGRQVPGHGVERIRGRTIDQGTAEVGSRGNLDGVPSNRSRSGGIVPIEAGHQPVRDHT